MNKRAIIYIVVIIVLGILGFLAMIRFQGQETNMNNANQTVNVNK